VKQYLTIEERKSTGLFSTRPNTCSAKRRNRADLPPFERLLMERLFRGPDPEVSVSDLKHAFYKNLDDLKNAAFESLERLKCFAANPSSVKTGTSSRGSPS
jgi:hypothetical protein